jgi:hypothetical protein
VIRRRRIRRNCILATSYAPESPLRIVQINRTGLGAQIAEQEPKSRID